MFQTGKIEPQLGMLINVKGIVPHIKGDIMVELEKHKFVK
jgi:hypothetical protein